MSAGIVLKVPYTKIDWDAYMQQVALYAKGERDYMKLVGETGPLVYPAGHVYVFAALRALTSGGTDVRLAQWLFVGIYLATEAAVFRLYVRAKTPLYAFPLVVLSKRLHSIYMLRMFNDGVAMLGAFIAMLLWQSQWWLVGSIVFSAAVTIKMNVLLFLPAAGAILIQALGPRAFRGLMLMMQVQLLVAYPFTSKAFVSYAVRAFDFQRVFMYKWTVNWRFVDEAVFLSAEFRQTLLVLHGAVALLFVVRRWLRPSGMSVVSVVQMVLVPMSRPAVVQQQILAKMTPDYVLSAMATSNLIGVLFARSLHYQFYSWFAWTMPYLMSQTAVHPVAQYALWLAQEWAWNVYPSTPLSSLATVAVNAVVVVALYVGREGDYFHRDLAPRPPPEMASVSVTEVAPVAPPGKRRSLRQRTRKN
ncbi:glycosyltransferase [Dipodascopsis tothii]|uniref:glycosyltransferase n=1 Tax=Dipodascopsis tothii TaxID=44089 RepID=UPI0034CFBF8E